MKWNCWITHLNGHSNRSPLRMHDASTWGRWTCAKRHSIWIYLASTMVCGCVWWVHSAQLTLRQSSPSPRPQDGRRSSQSWVAFCCSPKHTIWEYLETFPRQIYKDAQTNSAPPEKSRPFPILRHRIWRLTTLETRLWVTTLIAWWPSTWLVKGVP